MPTRYAGRADEIRALVRDREVHRDLYVDPGIFDLEMKHLFANTWVYVGHASQVPNSGDYFTTTIGVEPVVMVRHSDGTVKVCTTAAHTRGPRSPMNSAETRASSSAAPTTPGASRPMEASSRFR